ncbi:MAG TPA: LysR substrate-binding domain-containing protein [Steroidobacteraceae bacterium]|nr:LysR substrate-binding domain-containing protein [Steroidobacteraceae bacterium]
MRFDHVFADADHGPVPRRLPPLHALEVFVAAARCGTFSRAAKQLLVTQGAISRQVKLLEDHMGLSLFVRHKRGVRLTSEGEALLPVVEDTFARLARMCDSLCGVGQVLTVRMPPTLAVRWFLPLLPSLRAVMPDVDIRVSTDDSREPRFDDSDVDAAIIYGRGNWPGVEAIRLMPERLTPVCSPELASRLSSPADLKLLPLLQCYPVQAWSRWLEAAGVGWIATHRGQTFDTLEFALSAATRSQGVALGDINLLKETLRDGVLVAPFDTVLDQGISYFLIYPSQRGQLPKIRALREWLTTAATATV